MDELITRHLDYHATARPMAAMEIDYPSGASTGLHAHPRGQLLYAIEGVMIVRCAEGTWVVPPNRAVWLVAGLEHEVRMCGAVKIRTVFVDAGAAPDLPQTSCVFTVSPLLRELFVAAMRVPLFGMLLALWRPLILAVANIAADDILSLLKPAADAAPSAVERLRRKRD